MAEAANHSTNKDDEHEENISEASEDSDFDIKYTCDLCKTSFSGLKSLRQHERSGKHLKALRRQKLQKEIDEDLKNLNLGDNSGDEDFTVNKVVAECEVCNKEFNGPESYRQHLKSKSHKRKIEEVRLLEMAKEDGKVNTEKLKELLQRGRNSSKGEASAELLDSDEDSYKCEDCQKVFSGLIPFRDHLVSKTHLKVLKEKKLMEKLVADSDEDDAIEIEQDILVCKICNSSFSGIASIKAHLKGKKHSNMVEFLEWKKEKKRLKKEVEKESKPPHEISSHGETEESDDDKKTNQRNETSV